MEFIPIKTRPLIPPKDNIFEIFDKHVSAIKNGDIIFITSKIVAIHQGKCLPIEEVSKRDLVERESDKRIISDVVPGKGIYLTIKNNILIPSAGIDESNANGHYILRPDDLSNITKEIHSYFCEKYQIQDFGVIITDSTTRPLKWGVTGISIYSYGIYPLTDMRGQEDIFGKKLEITQINITDALSAMAVYLMGEGNECKPIVIGRDIPKIIYTKDDVYNSVQIPPEQDLFKPLLKPLLQ